MSKNTNRKQMEILLSTMQLYPEIARGWFKGNKEELNRMWLNLEAELNASGPPSKSIAEWKKVWCDQKKYVRHKAAQNLKHAEATGGGPYMEQKLSTHEEAIYDLIGMKESVEGVANTFGLGTSTNKKPTAESVSNVLLELLDEDDVLLENSVHDINKEIPQKKKFKPDDAVVTNTVHESGKETPKKATKKDTQNDLHKHVSSSDVLAEEICIQKKMLEEMKAQNINSKKVYRSIDRLYDIKKSELEEQKRHNLVMEKLRLREIEDKMEKNRRLLELEELKLNH